MEQKPGAPLGIVGCAPPHVERYRARTASAAPELGPFLLAPLARRRDGADVGDVDNRTLQAVAIKDLAAGTRHQRAGFLRWQPLTARPHRILPFGPVARVAPRLKVGLSSL